MLSQHILFLVWLALILSAGLLFLTIYILYKLWRLNALKRLLLTGKNGQNMEQILQYMAKNQENMKDEQSEFAKNLGHMVKKLDSAIQKIGVVRFNPFDDGGGNFSFCLALLNGHNDGVVITSMYGRQQQRIYSKKISSGISDSQMTEEEKQAIRLAIENK